MEDVMDDVSVEEAIECWGERLRCSGWIDIGPEVSEILGDAPPRIVTKSKFSLVSGCKLIQHQVTENSFWKLDKDYY